MNPTKNDFCKGCKNFDEEDCGNDTEIFECDYKVMTRKPLIMIIGKYYIFAKEEFGNRLSQFALISLRSLIMAEVDKLKIEET